MTEILPNDVSLLADPIHDMSNPQLYTKTAAIADETVAIQYLRVSIDLLWHYTSVIYAHTSVLDDVRPTCTPIEHYTYLLPAMRPLFTLGRDIRRATTLLSQQLLTVAEQAGRTWSSNYLQHLVLAIDAIVSLDLVIRSQASLARDATAFVRATDGMDDSQRASVGADASAKSRVIEPLRALGTTTAAGAKGIDTLLATGALVQLLVSRNSPNMSAVAALLASYAGNRLVNRGRANNYPLLSTSAYMSHLRTMIYLPIIFGGIDRARLPLVPHAACMVTSIITKLPLAPVIGQVSVFWATLYDDVLHPDVAQALRRDLRLPPGSPTEIITKEIESNDNIFLAPVLPLIRLQHVHVLAAVAAAVAAADAAQPAAGTECYRATVRAVSFAGSWHRRLLFMHALSTLVKPETFATCCDAPFDDMAEVAILVRDVAAALTKCAPTLQRGARAHVARAMEFMGRGDVQFYVDSLTKTKGDLETAQKHLTELLTILPKGTALPVPLPRPIRRAVVAGLSTVHAAGPHVSAARKPAARALAHHFEAPGVPAAAVDVSMPGLPDTGRLDALAALVDRAGSLSGLGQPLSVEAVLAAAKPAAARHLKGAGGSYFKQHVTVAADTGASASELRAAGGTWMLGLSREIVLWQQLRSVPALSDSISSLVDLGLAATTGNTTLDAMIAASLDSHLSDGVLTLLSIPNEAARWALVRARSLPCYRSVQHASNRILRAIVEAAAARVWSFTVSLAAATVCGSSQYFGEPLPRIGLPAPPPDLAILDGRIISLAGHSVDICAAVSRQLRYHAATDVLAIFKHAQSYICLQTLPELHVALEIIRVATSETLPTILPLAELELSALIDAFDGRSQAGRYTSHTLSLVSGRLLRDLPALAAAPAGLVRAREPAPVVSEAVRVTTSATLPDPATISGTPMLLQHLSLGAARQPLLEWAARSAQSITQLHLTAMRRIYVAGDEQPAIDDVIDAPAPAPAPAPSSPASPDLGPSASYLTRRRASSTAAIIAARAAAASGAPAEVTETLHNPPVMPGILVFVDILASVAVALCARLDPAVTACAVVAPFGRPDLAEGAQGLLTRTRAAAGAAAERGCDIIEGILTALGVLYQVSMDLRRAVVAANSDAGTTPPDLLIRFVATTAEKVRETPYWQAESVAYTIGCGFGGRPLATAVNATLCQLVLRGTLGRSVALGAALALGVFCQGGVFLRESAPTCAHSHSSAGLSAGDAGLLEALKLAGTDIRGHGSMIDSIIN